MKRILGVIVGLLLCSTVYAKSDATWQLIIDSEAVTGTAAIYSEAFVVGSMSDFSYCFTTHESTATVDIDLFVQVIDSNSSDYSVVGSTSDTSVDPNFNVTYSTHNYQNTWVTIKTGGTLITAQGSDTKVTDGLSLPVTRWFRFKVEGSGSNSGGTVNRVSLTLGRYGQR